MNFTGLRGRLPELPPEHYYVLCYSRGIWEFKKGWLILSRRRRLFWFPTTVWSESLDCGLYDEAFLSRVTHRAERVADFTRMLERERQNRIEQKQRLNGPRPWFGIRL